MKTLLFVLICVYAGYAQEYTHRVSNASSIEMEFTDADIEVQGHAGSEIVIRRSGTPLVRDERAEGLTLVSEYPDNTGTGFYLKEDGQVVKILRQDFGKVSITMLIPERISISIRQFQWSQNTIRLEGLKGAINVKSTNSDVYARNVDGPCHIDAVSGDVELFAAGFPIDLKSVSGEVKVHIPAQTPADLSLRTISGRIESDFAVNNTIVVKGSTLTQVGKIKKVDQPINGGGELVKLESVSGRIKLLSNK